VLQVSALAIFFERKKNETASKQHLDCAAWNSIDDVCHQRSTRFNSNRSKEKD